MDAQPTPCPTPATPGRKLNDQRMFGHLREIRAAAQWLQDSTAEALSRAAGLDAGLRVVSTTGALSSALQQRLDAVVTPQLDAIRQLFLADAEEYDWCADQVATISLTWASIKDLWPTAAMQWGDIEQKLGELSSKVDQLVYECASLTLSPRVNDVLCNLRIGQALDFDFEFESELPKDSGLRKRLLLELAQQGGVLQAGVVDAEERMIYKIAESRKEQIWSAVRLVLWLLAGAAIIPAILAVLKSPTTWMDLLPTLLKDYALIFAGSGAHLAVAAIKASKAQTRPSFQPINDWVLWLHVRETKVFWGFAYVWLGYVLLTMSTSIEKLNWEAAFFAGYSIDSVVELLLERFETTVKSKVQSVVPVTTK
jgi:hypothetical protein